MKFKIFKKIKNFKKRLFKVQEPSGVFKNFKKQPFLYCGEFGDALSFKDSITLRLLLAFFSKALPSGWLWDF